MSALTGKKILLGITGGIAAYKTPILVRQLIQKGAQVRVILSPAAKDFVAPLTLATLSKHDVLSEFVSIEDKDNPQWNNHVELGLWADLFLIAPATANTLSKMAQGTCDNLLLATYLSAKCPVYYAPAMDLDMYAHASTHNNFKILNTFGNIQIPSEEGELASGLVGKGRMAEPENIVSFLEAHLRANLPFYGKHFLITAGPTYEAIDPVRFIGNHSSGKMGYALAEEAAKLGASVTLISGPTTLTIKHPFIKRVNVTSAQEMYKAALMAFKSCDVAIFSAAVADYRPKNVASQKVKKKDANWQITLEKTPDIALEAGQQKENQFLVGFALETENELVHAKSKLEKKNLDLIVLNSLKDKEAGFGLDTNKITLITKDNKTWPFEVKSKTEVARDILDFILQQLHA